MNAVLLYVTVLLLLLLYFYREAKQHERNLLNLPLRIHVNGTRGKSSVTRLIAAGLRAGEHKVLAKTTGTAAKLILPDGSEQDVYRRGPANIRENIAVVQKAADCGADTIVIECMAINPELQKFCEKRIIKSHIGVITNIRLDHEDVMGSGIANIARSLSNTIPEQGLLVTIPESKRLLEAVNKKVPIVAVSGEQLDSGFQEGFPYEIMPDNVAIALKVCELAGVDAATAVAGMRAARPDTGNFAILNIILQGKSVKVVNALAANDSESTLLLWQKYWEPDVRTLVLINCRKDRKLRTRQLCECLVNVHHGSFILAGDMTFGKMLLKHHGVLSDDIHCLSAKPNFQEIIDIIKKCTEDRVALFAAGNIKGFSQKFLMNLNGG